MAKTKDEKNKDAFVKTEVNKRLFNYNDPKNFNTTYSQEDINSFLSGSNTKVQEVFGKPKSPDYIGGINPLGDQIDFTGSKYDKNIHVDQLDNLEDFRSQNQGIFDSLGRSTANLIGKTAVNIVGGVVGTAYGAVDAIAEGKISNLWDNDLTTALDKASADIGDYFKVYKSADYNDSNLLSKAFLHPIQFTDETMDALSFTTGAILTEMLTSGVASGMVGAKALKYFKQLDKIADASEIGSTLSKAGSIANGLKNTGTLTRQLATGAAYEASIEARQASNQLRDKLHQDWLQANPGASIEQMPQSIKDSIDDKLADAGLFTFMTNLALVGSSNIIQFPKVFGAGYETANKAKNFEKRLIREASGRFSDVATKASKFEKGLSKAMTIAKNPFMEGIVEEGGQGVLSGTAIDFFSRKNDESSRSSVSDFLEDFGKNLIDTYTTKEGWNEIGMGMLIGSIGAPGRGLLSFLGKNSTLGQQGFNADGTRKELWDGGIVGELRQEAEKTREISEYIQDLNNNTSIIRAMKSNYDFLVNSRFLEDRMDYALDTGDIFTYNNLKDDQVHSYITSRLKAGLSSDIDTTIEQLQQIDPSELYRELKGIESLEQASEEDQIEFKRRSIEEFKNKAEATKKAYQIVDNAYQGDNDDIRDYFAHSIAKAKYTDLREKAINKAVSDLSYGALNNLNTRSLDTVTIKDEIESLNTILKEENIDEIEAEKINTLLNALNIVEDKQRSLTREEYNALQLVGQADDLNLSLNIDKITSLLEDSRKLRKQRQDYISVYNQIFTKEGQAKVKAEQDAYNNMLKAQEDARIKAERIAKAEADRIQEEEQVFNNQKETKLKVDSLKETAPIKKNESVEEEDDTDYDNLTFGEATFQPEGSNLVETVTPEENTVANIVTYEENHAEEVELNQDNGLVINNPTEISSYSFDDLSFKREAGNTLNSLNIKYSERILGDTEKQSDEYRIFDEYTEDGKLDIISNFDSRLQDPNQFNKGTILKVIIPTYDQIKQKGIELEGYTEDQFNNDSKSSKNIPIALTDSNDKIIGYLSTQDNIKKRVKPELIDIELVKNIELRNKIFENKDSNMTLTISNKSTGTPMLQKNKVSIYDALGDGTKLAKDVKIGIFKEGKLQIGTNIINQDRLKLPEGVSESDYFNEGFAYAIVPTASKDTYFAMNLDASQVGDRSNEIIKILELYKATDKFKEDKNLLTLRDQLSVEADFTNFKDVSDALNNIIYINNDNDNHILRLDKNKLILGATPDMQFTWNQFRDPVIKENIKNILSNRSSAIKLANFGTPFSTFVNNNGNFEFKRYNNYFDYINEYEILKSNQQSEPITGTTNSRYFTAQSVIELGDLKINSNTPSNPIVESINTQVEEPKGVKMSSKPKNKLGLKIPNKNKPRIDEDFSEIYTLENKTLDEQVNDLIKKCSK